MAPTATAARSASRLRGRRPGPLAGAGRGRPGAVAKPRRGGGRRALAFAALAALLVAAPVAFPAGAAAAGATAEAPSGARVAVRVDGLACPFCAYGIEKKLREVPGVAAASTDLATGVVTLELEPGAEPDLEAIRRAVERAGFTPKGVEVQGTGEGGAEEAP